MTVVENIYIVIQDFIRSEGKGDLLAFNWVLRCSMCMLRCLSMSSMPYYSIYMPTSWNGLSMPTEECPVSIPIIITNSKLKGVGQNSVQYMMKVTLTHISVECGIFNPFVYRLFNGSG